MNKSEVIRGLLIEDNPGDARLIREMLGDSAGVRFDIQCADRLSTGMDYLTEGSRESDEKSPDLSFYQSPIVNQKFPLTWFFSTSHFRTVRGLTRLSRCMMRSRDYR